MDASSGFHDIQAAVDVVPAYVSRLVQTVVGGHHVANVAEVWVQQDDPFVDGIQDENESGVGGGEVGGRAEWRLAAAVRRLRPTFVVDETHAVDTVQSAAVAHDEAASCSRRHQRAGHLERVPRTSYAQQSINQWCKRMQA